MKNTVILIFVCVALITVVALIVGGEVRVPGRADDISVTWGMFK